MRAARALALEVPSATLDALVDYLDLLDRWNQVHNLTAVRGRRKRRIQHLHDSLSIAAALRRGTPTPTPRILDVGSGAGLPGVVIAMIWPGAHVECVDAVGKKAAFVAHAAATLRLLNLASTHARVESLPASEPFDIVTARAFATLHDAVVATRRLLKVDGVWALAKGRRPDDELASLPTDVDVFHVEHLTVPELEAERHLVWIRVGA